MNVRLLLCALLPLLLVNNSLDAQEKKLTREQKVRGDKERVTAEGFWIYNDLPAAYAKAKETGKPILVILRCLPCEECVKLDDEVVDQDPIVRPLLEKFVCVRVVSTNGLDLNLFQYDTDQSFAGFMLNADGTIYGRFGTRSHRTEWIGDVSLEGLAEALRGALELHRNYPAIRDSLAGKRGPKPLYDRPELFPSLKDKYKSTIDYSGDVVKSCIHCHQIGDALRDHYRSRNEPIPEEVIYPYPHPKSIGLVLDPKKKATVREVTEGSPAAKAGILPGDNILSMNGQPLLSTADVQWVLHQTSPEGGTVELKIDRTGNQQSAELDLPSGWRREGDISWRVSAWGFRRMASGGLVLEELEPAERAKRKIPEDKMALRVRHVGQYDAHAAAKRAGFLVDDIILSVDGKTDLLTEAQFLTYGLTEKKAGQAILTEVLRGKEKLKLEIPMQK